ncbi:enoyl-CoA hydratase [marine bacterium AO1-C]|nr:enoyl-CoA hydratase [marine bacterium AO1-C]
MAVLETKTEGHVLHMVLNRSEKMNAFNLEMLAALAAAYTQLEDQDELRCGVLYANGDHFTAGLDLGEVGPYVKAGNPLFPADKIDPAQVSGRKRTKPVVMAVQGYCLTLGIELILAADICIAATQTKFGQIEIKRGIYPFCGATIRLMQRAGWGNAMRYLLTGDMFDAQEAHRIGLVQEISENPIETAIQIATTISQQAPLGVYATLKNAQIVLDEGEEAAKQALVPAAIELMNSEDADEGLQSFLERRKADFKGK